MYADRWVSVHGVRLRYQAWGSPEDPPLLLLHGLTQQSHAFDAVAARLAPRYHALALDLRGRGESGWAPPESYTIPQYVADVRAFLDALDLPGAHVFGTSMGGLVGLSLAAEAPGCVRSLGLNDIGPEVDPRGAARIAAYTAAVPEALPSFDAALEWALAHYPWLAGTARERAAEAVRWAVRARADGTWQFKFDPAIGRGVRPAPATAEAAARRWWAAWRGLSCPLLLLRGAESDVMARETAEAMARLQPRLLRVEVPGVGHAPTLQEPEAVAALERFYLGRGAPGGVPPALAG